MKMDDDNRRRAFGTVASLDAWHEKFTVSRRRAKLHVDVVFADARLGGEPDDEVRFRLRLKRAEVVVVISRHEQIEVDKASVSRDAPQVKVKQAEKRSTKRQAKGGVDFNAGVSIRGPSAAGKVGAGAHFDATQEAALKVTRETGGFAVTQIQTDAGEYAWIVEPVASTVLAGRPWDAMKAPRLALIDRIETRKRTIDPAVNVEIRCRREDLEIRDIALTQARDLAAMAKDPLWQNKVKAAEAVIRTRLARAGLLKGDISDPFAEIVLCATLATEA